MRKILIILGTLLMATVLVLGACASAVEELPPEVAPPLEEVAAPGEAEQEVVEEEAAPAAVGISGTYIPCPEAEGKLQVTHRLLYAFGKMQPGSAPMIELVIKNVSDTRITARVVDEIAYNFFSIKVVSKDGAGNILGETTKATYGKGLSIGGYHDALEPKEVRTREVRLFCSDEVKSYEVIMEYHPLYELPDISGVYIETPTVKNLVNLTHSIQKVDKGERYYLFFWYEIKNISSKTIGEYYSPFGVRVIPESLDVKVVFKDAAGKILDSKIWRVADGGLPSSGKADFDLIPNESKHFESTVPRKFLKDISYYELTVEYQERVYQ